MITTVEMREDVARELAMFMAITGRRLKEQSKVINELILAGIENEKAKQIGEQGNAKAPCPA
jgi:KaiC/GvpD/RAD55 family RecA-like ATPase